MVENTVKNREKLVEEVVDSWDMDTLLSYAKNCLTDNYVNSDDDFQRDWESEFEEN